MVVVLKKGAEKSKMEKLVEELISSANKKGVNTLKYCGVLSIKENPIDMQKKMRDEWE